MKISFEDFAKLEIKVCTIIAVEPVPDTDKLLKLTIDCGEEERQVISGIKHLCPDYESLVGKQSPFLMNLEPRTIKGFESQAMILAAGDDDSFVLLSPEETVTPGTAVR